MTDEEQQPPKKRKFHRAARACERCRAKKYRCDESFPCGNCKKMNVHCAFEGDDRLRQRMDHSSYVAELERQVLELSQKTPDPRSRQSTEVTTTRNDTTLSTNSIANNLYPETVAQHDIVDDSEGFVDSGDEFRDVNKHTNNVEFHGKTSSMAFLASLQQRNPSQVPAQQTSLNQKSPTDKPSLVSTLHNEAFSPQSPVQPIPENSSLESCRYHFRQSWKFIDGYFDSLHYIHPIVDKTSFLSRCEDLWFGRPEGQPKSFVALYCSVLALGAIVRIWDEDTIEGLNRFQWSRKLFAHARSALGDFSAINDLETVQCLIFMAKVCQNELNPNLAYMYLGMATRACLSAGFNRASPKRDEAEVKSTGQGTVSKTWWGLYSLEMEMSFSLGRPDSLGLDEYHNRPMPPLDGTETDILAVMIPFARIIRKVSVQIYLAETSIFEKARCAGRIEDEMSSWLSSLPTSIKPELHSSNGFKILKDPKWSRRQKLVLRLRYFNVMMVLHRPFLTYAAKNSSDVPNDILSVAMNKCLNAARQTIEVMHETFRSQIFFRTWWYNTTYVLYAASIVLSYLKQICPEPERDESSRLMRMVVEVLEAMDESNVARKAAGLIKQAVTEIETNDRTLRAGAKALSDLRHATAYQPPNPILPTPQHSSTNQANIDFDWNFSMVGIDETYPFWTDLNLLLDGFNP